MKKTIISLVAIALVTLKGEPIELGITCGFKEKSNKKTSKTIKNKGFKPK